VRVVATIIFAIGIAGLFFLDRRLFTRLPGNTLSPRPRLSIGLWLPMLWLWFAMTRPLSVWLGLAPVNTPEQLLEGNPIERQLIIILIALGLLVLALRASQAGSVLRANAPIVLLFFYCGISVAWSDYPEVATKRLIRACGDMVMVLIVLTEPNPSLAIRWLLTRLAFLIMPLSILFIRYYPELGRAYHRWEGIALYTGVTTNKNLMGMVCLALGIALVAYFLQLLRHRDRNQHRGPLLAYGATLVMLLWVLWQTSSTTSAALFVLVSGLIVVTNLMPWLRRPAALSLTVGVVVMAAVYGLILNPGAGLITSLGKDATLTGRTELWMHLLEMPIDSLVGTGFESFWLGDRLERLWALYWWRPNQAHNGYLEFLLNLGWIGIVLFAVVLVTGFRNVLVGIRWDRDEGGLRLGFFVAALLYNLTEAAFKFSHPLWILLLWAIMARPVQPGRQVRRAANRATKSGMALQPGVGKARLRATVKEH
jgi:O-antigen ligase